jgi:hypothetical protein
MTTIRYSAALALVLGLAIVARSPAADRERSKPAAPALGGAAPTFVLLDLEGKEFRLKDHAGKRPVVIEFGSYT